MTNTDNLKLEGFKESFMKRYQKSQQEQILKIAHSLLAEGVDRTLVKEVTGLRDEDLTQ
ncbi:hypothetical protein HB991_02385 [Yersinia mollaretii]|uniref:Uncharacterized protein n=1 Tax=Yersinia mollaretii TaxID=33060 RepID=A0AA44CIM2_YERMO|nr:hypothetical protein [Yersinia mollaretii]NIL21377.1 hypothetical protein [Yersinia mollaretii]CNI85533.1 Uncharacterised protein [Yersinia mollaretii]CNK20097.1 Uncharacterised protein [Yersinia enterocolitica]CQQ61860.1 Uncharacterised protein [Yersinia mollaretii]